jgi:hypothetical protein
MEIRKGQLWTRKDTTKRDYDYDHTTSPLLLVLAAQKGVRNRWWCLRAGNIREFPNVNWGRPIPEGLKVLPLHADDIRKGFDMVGDPFAPKAVAKRLVKPEDDNRLSMVIG